MAMAVAVAVAMETSSSAAPCTHPRLPSPSFHFSGVSLFRPHPTSSACRPRRSPFGDAPAPPAFNPQRRRSVVVPAVSFGGILDGLFKKADDGEATRKKYEALVSSVNSLEGEIGALSDDELRQRTVQFKERSSKGESLDALLPEAFAVVREASKRVLGLRPFDVQLIGGIVLHKGEIAEMKTGEGKTLVAVLPAYLNALAGRGVHVVTVNDYLARRDCEWVGQVHRFLGLRVGLIQQGMTSEERKENYLCDVTYVTNSELGFDYLRDNLASSMNDLVLRGFQYCIIDEVDSILIDEARTPLIISGPAEKPSEKYYKAAKIASAFGRDIHYTVDEKRKTILLTEQGYEDTEEILDVKDLYDPREQWASYILNAIKAKELFLKDVNYIVKGQEVVIVDEFTGRVMQGRRWSEGLHQAVEAKEGLPIENETVTLASISYQNFFLQYAKLCGMTGTAATEIAEFEKIYKLAVTVVPTNQPMMRKDESDVVFRVAPGKWRAVVSEISRMYRAGRPVLIGTTSVEQSEALGKQLDEVEIPYQVLNAKPENAEREAEIVSQSGRLGSVTIATNMAGRGTDIILGGNAEFMARLKLREFLMPRVVQSSSSDVELQNGNKAPQRKTWKTNPSLFPCEVSPLASSAVEEAVQAAVDAWGENCITELEAENRLSYACEKGPTNDVVISKLREAFQLLAAGYKSFTVEEKKKVIAAGGLHVIGTERHESRRIDNQLRGRSGRQGDPGSSRFFLSLEDNIFRIFGGDRIQNMMRAFNVEDLPIESKMLSKALDEAQRKVENYFFEIRKQLYEFDEVLNSQRERVYTERRRALESTDLQSQMLEYAELTMDDIVQANVDPSSAKEDWNFKGLVAKVQQYCYLLNDLTDEKLTQNCSDYESLKDYLRRRGREAYLLKRLQVEEETPGLMTEAERYFVLSQTDRLWKEHLQALKFLQQAVGLRGYAQRDPLVEYKLEGYNLFLELMAQIRRNVIYSVYQFKPIMVNAKQDADAQNGKEDRPGENDDSDLTATTTTSPVS